MTKSVNIYATIYEGKFDINFDCAGEINCKFALCELMPPTGEQDCEYKQYGSCLSPLVKLAAIESLRNRLKRESKQIEEALNAE